MMLDVLIILVLILAILRGRQIGLVQQVFSIIGFFGGLLLGVLLRPWLVQFGTTAASKSAITLGTTLGMAVLGLAFAEWLSQKLKKQISSKKVLENLDASLGALAGGLGIAISLWLIFSSLQALPMPALRLQLQQSRLIRFANQHLPNPPNLLAGLGHILDPSLFPQAFSGLEPNPPAHINIPSSSQLANAVAMVQKSVVKIESQGCGSAIEGSGFVAGNNLVITNAHVVAGITKPYVVDDAGTHPAQTVWFDPQTDIAVLKTSGLAGRPVSFAAKTAASGTPVAVMGYPGGGGFTADPAAILDMFHARGKNIYDSGTSIRQIYSVKAAVVPGNSGGPIVLANGEVVGVIFAQSTTYPNVGYALTAAAATQALRAVGQAQTTVSTGSCLSH